MKFFRQVCAIVLGAMVGMVSSMRKRTSGLNWRITPSTSKITLEEHFLAPGQPGHPALDSKLRDFDGDRLQQMDDAGVEIQILSYKSDGLQNQASVAQARENAVKWNDWTADIVRNHPSGRYRAFAALPMSDPAFAAKELKRCMSMNKSSTGFSPFVGGIIHGFDTTGGADPRYYDTQDYIDLFWKEVQDYPIYLHPRTPAEGHLASYEAEYPVLQNSVFGFHHRLAEQILMLIFGGVFYQCPRLQMIVGHLGETIPWMASRSDAILKATKGSSVTKEALEKVPEFGTDLVTKTLRRNFHITTSGFFDTPAFKHTVEIMGIDRVMFSIDYPFASSAAAAEWIDGEGSETLTQVMYDKVVRGNAQRLLGL